MSDHKSPSPRRASVSSASHQQSIPLRDLRPVPEGQEGGGGRTSETNDNVRNSGAGLQMPSPSAAPMSANVTGLSTYWEHPYPPSYDDRSAADSPIDHMALQFALPPNISGHGHEPPPSASYMPGADDPYSVPHPYYEERTDTDSLESDRVPLKPAAQPIGRLDAPEGDAAPRDSFQTVSDLGNSSSRPRNTMLGFDLENNFTADRHRSYGDSLVPDDRRRSRSLSTSGALSRAGSIMRAMSQRVVMISGEGDLIDQQTERDRSRSPSMERPRPGHASGPMLVDTSYPSQTGQTPTEKRPESHHVYPQHPPTFRPRSRDPRNNPLKGKSLGIFPPDNPLRLWLCDLLVNPWAEPFILVLIVLQVVLLAVEAAPDVLADGNGRPERWGSTRIDWAIFVLFVIFTIELVSRIIVSGFIINAPEYEEAKSKRRFHERLAEQYRVIFRPQRQRSVRQPRPEHFEPAPFTRSFTMAHSQIQTLEDQQRRHLARRAFLRHGFNRLDFVAVISFWISFVLGVTGLESKHHMYVFRMLSCLRIIRLLALTKGNLIILRSLKKAAPLLVRVSFLMGFFWLLFAIIGVQSFKSSLSRQCLWIDPDHPTDFHAAYTPDFTFCGGHIDNATGETMPWVYSDEKESLTGLKNGTSRAKGFLCPRGSICIRQQNPFNGTVNFDDIGHSLELVFVIMSANTFSDLMYYTISSDFLPSALFYGAGIIIMMLWMTNLLIAVITSSFQVIREESKASAFTADEPPGMASSRADDAMRRPTLLQKIYSRTKPLWILIVAFGLLAQSLRSARMRSGRERFVNIAEPVVTLLLDVEIIIRLAADIRGFHRRKRNLVDLGLAVATSIILIPPIRNSGQVYNWLTVFQILRVYRVVMVIPMTRKLIRLVLGNVTGIGNLMSFVFLITFLMAIFAAQLFRGELPRQDDDGDEIRIPFNTIYNCFLGMYQVLSSENWTDILYSVTASTHHLHTAWIGAIFLVGWFILAYFILINMFIAVIQENFDVGEDVKRLEQVKAFLQRKELGHSASSNLALSKVLNFGRSKKQRDPLDYGPAMMEMLLKEAVVHDFLDDDMDPLQQSAPDGQPTPQLGSSKTMQYDGVTPGILSAAWGKFVSLFSSREPNPFYSNVNLDGLGENLDPRTMAAQAMNATKRRARAQREYLMRHPNYNKSLFIFTPKNPIRRLCQSLVGPGRGTERAEGDEPNTYAWYIFSTLIYAAIVAMVVLACITTPLYQKEYFEKYGKTAFNWFVWADTGFAIVFTVEALIKVIADGFLWTPNAYFRSTWGVIDAIVLITLWINVITLFTRNGAVSRAVGAFKALRALRLLNISESARDTFHSLLIVGGWKILSAAFVSISLLIPFAIYGVNLFHGKLLACNDSSEGIVRLDDCFGEWNSTPYNNDWPVLAPRSVSNPYFSFDDFGSSLFILFQIVSQEGWVDVSFALQAITGRGLQPQSEAPYRGQGNALFLIVFNLLATVFVLTLFISVFMRNYTEQTGVAFLTAEQRSWLELRKLLRQISPSKSSYDESKNKWKLWCHKRAIEKRGKWYVAITSVLVFHLVLLLSEFYSEPDWWTITRDALFLLFTLIYIANIVIRIVGLGWSRFRKSSWDMFSLVTVTGAFATTILFMTDTKLDTYIQLHKFFLVAIVLMLIPRNDALDQLFKTAAASLTTIGSLLATWLVFFLVFAIALTQTFSLTRFGKETDYNINLRTVPNALILLFRFSCGEGWNAVMEDFAKIKPPLCVEGVEFSDSDCGSTAWARALFIAWNIISMYIFVNLFVSLIYESFSYVYQRTSGLAMVDRDEIRRFKEAWRSVDPAGTGFISKEAFPRLLGELSGVFEMRIYDSRDSVRQILEDVRGEDTSSIRHASIISTTQFQTSLDLKKLNERISQIDVAKVKERRRRYNIFFEEVMVSADSDRGISFTSVLMILAHYKIINDSKSLRLEEFLRRRARLQRVDEAVQRRVVLGFFDMIYYSRKFQRHMELKRSARLTAIPQLGVPEIYVDNDQQSDNEQQNKDSNGNNSARASGSGAAGGTNPFESSSTNPFGSGSTALSPGGAASFLSADDARAHHRSWSGVSADLSSFDTSYGHPLAGPRANKSSNSASHRNTHAYSFELHDSLGIGGGNAPSPGGWGSGSQTMGSMGLGGGSAMLDENNGGRSPGGVGDAKRGSSVSPAQLSSMLDDSVWVASIRRSATMRRGQNDTDWGGGSGRTSGGGYSGAY
ncbi:Ion transport protein-domain-containing protein [Copromyces sp. CBS 386.78]|nr:Ion transport protein-domain-containing protein [Copromyces sp. CBS 386.78]